MKRSRSLITLLFLALCISLCTPAFAADTLFSSPREKALFEQISTGHYIKARQEAEEILKSQPDSIEANYILAHVFWLGEGNHMRSMQLFKKVLKLFEEKYCQVEPQSPNKGPIPRSSDLQVWHQRIYKELADVYAELDMRKEELAIHQKVADLYDAKLSEDAVWALIKLDRFDEARKISEQSIKGQNTFWAEKAYNNMTALEDARHGHLDAFHASSRAVEFAAGKSCVILMNHARSYAVFLDIPKAIEHDQKAMAAKQRDCVNSPMSALASFYLINGSWQKAITAMLKARKRKVEKRYTISVEMEERAGMADILYFMGFSERAWPLMKTVVEAPGRQGYDSLLKEQVEMGNNINYYAITNDALRRTEEALNAYYRLEPFWLFKSNIRTRVRELQKDQKDMLGRLWSTNQKLFKEALNTKNLKSFIVPFYVITPAYFYAIADALGRRTAEFFIDFQKSLLIPEELKAMNVIYDQMGSYIAWRDGDLDKALELAQKVEAENRPQTALLINQTKAIHADILRQQGKTTEAYNMMVDIYKVFPSVFRHFDIKLPIQFDNSMSSSEILEDIKDVLSHSSRFEVAADAPLVISGSKSESMVQICISSKLGSRFACSSTLAKDYGIETDKTPHPAEIINNFYHQAFTPKVDLSQADLNSLDGSPVQVSADQALEKLLNTTPQLDDDLTLPDELLED